ncbi:MAG TPA: ferritin-like domain-containing protein [Candidatus Binataceae bacterium]|nr:ferritin-like domain-containing protein [Candidatus Binataceae bacterium]
MAQLTEKINDFFTIAEVNNEALMDTLSEFLAVEMGGQKLYEKAITLVFDPEVKTKFREFLRQTRHHQKVLTDVICKLDGDPKMRSASAKVADEKAQALLRSMVAAGLSKEQRQLNAIENIVLAETKDHSDWELLGKVARQTGDKRLREVLIPAVDEVEDEEDEHVNWSRNKLGELSMMALSQERGSSREQTRTRVQTNGRRKSNTNHKGRKG